jgi:hypothetical protein
MTSKFLAVTLAAVALAFGSLVMIAPASATMLRAGIVHQDDPRLVHYGYIDVDGCSVSTPIGGVNICGGGDDDEDDDD